MFSKDPLSVSLNVVVAFCVFAILAVIIFKIFESRIPKLKEINLAKGLGLSFGLLFFIIGITLCSFGGLAPIFGLPALIVGLVVFVISVFTDAK